MTAGEAEELRSKLEKGTVVQNDPTQLFCEFNIPWSYMGQAEFEGNPLGSKFLGNLLSARLIAAMSLSERHISWAFDNTFSHMFGQPNDALRRLLNLELRLVYREYTKELRNMLSQGQLRVAMNGFISAVEEETTLAVLDLKQKMVKATDDPNFGVSSLFFQNSLAEQLLSSLVYACAQNIDIIIQLSAVEEISSLSHVASVSPRTLQNALEILLSRPKEILNSHLLLEEKLISVVGKQSVLRKDLLNRIGLVLSLTARQHERLIDNMVSLFPKILLKQLRDVLYISPIVQPVAARRLESDIFSKRFDTLGFVTAFRLLVLSRATGASLLLFDGLNRIIRVSSNRSQNDPIALVEVSNECADPRENVLTALSSQIMGRDLASVNRMYVTEAFISSQKGVTQCDDFWM